jgi:hypothetical protein
MRSKKKRADRELFLHPPNRTFYGARFARESIVHQHRQMGNTIAQSIGSRVLARSRNGSFSRMQNRLLTRGNGHSLTRRRPRERNAYHDHAGSGSAAANPDNPVLCNKVLQNVTKRSP